MLGLVTGAQKHTLTLLDSKLAQNSAWKRIKSTSKW
jgi:hypothetical protein